MTAFPKLILTKWPWPNDHNIRKMEPAWIKICGSIFRLTSRTIVQPNGGTREVPCYSLTKTECLYIATKFNDEARAKLVLRWEELEKVDARRQVAKTFNMTTLYFNAVLRDMGIQWWGTSPRGILRKTSRHGTKSVDNLLLAPFWTFLLRKNGKKNLLSKSFCIFAA